MPEFHIICGFLGAGKTTYSKKLAQEIGAEHLNADEWCMTRFKKEEYETKWEECFIKTVEMMWERAQTLSKEGKSVIFDTGFWHKKERMEAWEKAQKLGFTPIIDYVYAPDSVLKSRIARRNGKIAEHNLAHFEEIKQLFEVPDESETFNRIDNY